MYSEADMTLNRRKLLKLTSAGFAALALPGLANAKGKLELIMFDQVGCQWCAKWQKEVGGVYHKSYEGKRAPVRRVDMFGDRPAELAFIKDIVYSPTFVLVQDGRELGRITGYPGKAHFYVLLSQMLSELDRKKSGS